jgi:hypothetical protein
MRRYLIVWAVLTALGCAFVYGQTRLRLVELPDRASARWAYAALHAARSGETAPAPPPSAARYRSVGPVFVSVYAGGELHARHIGSGLLAEVVSAAARRFSRSPELQELPAWRDGSARFRIAVTRGAGPLMAAVPGLSVFSLVPLRDGLVAAIAAPLAPATLRSASGQRGGRPERRAYLLPDDLLERNLTDRAVVAPVPDLTFGTDLGELLPLLAEELDLPLPQLISQAQFQRLRVEPLIEEPQSDVVNRDALLAAARDGVGFVLRHQERSGRFMYIYDAQRDEPVESRNYSLARHSGTIFFLARAAHQLQLPVARRGALRAIDFLRRTALAQCGGEDRACIIQNDRVEMGAAALTALACAELLRGGDEPRVRALLQNLLGFLRAQQRADGELMHEYDRENDRPIDIQHMYYSGEAALALLSGYEQLKDERDLKAASRLMSHLTGAGWSFFGSRYYYGEEHWTCQAVGKAAAHMPVGSALDFCVRWGEWQRRLQYRAGQTPWPVEGAFGVGPVLVPRVTQASSRVEALVPIYRVLRGRGPAAEGIRELVQRSLGLLLRMRWAPGPAHLFARPAAAVGGIPSTAADLRSRVDMVQHAGSAMLAWAEQLGEERPQAPATDGHRNSSGGTR